MTLLSKEMPKQSMHLNTIMPHSTEAGDLGHYVSPLIPKFKIKSCFMR